MSLRKYRGRLSYLPWYPEQVILEMKERESQFTLCVTRSELSLFSLLCLYNLFFYLPLYQASEAVKREKEHPEYPHPPSEWLPASDATTSPVAGKQGWHVSFFFFSPYCFLAPCLFTNFSFCFFLLFFLLLSFSSLFLFSLSLLSLSTIFLSFFA